MIRVVTKDSTEVLISAVLRVADGRMISQEIMHKQKLPLHPDVGTMLEDLGILKNVGGLVVVEPYSSNRCLNQNRY